MEKNLGIWGNEECVMCGACCKDYERKLEKLGLSPCEGEQVIRNEKSYCSIHGTGEHSRICRTYFCGNIDTLNPNKEKTEQNLRKIAFELGTTPEIHTKI